MTQEILDYFWIRSLIIANYSDELIKIINNKECFSYFIEKIIILIEKDDLILTSDKLIERVESVIQRYRFQYNKDKKINDDINKIILALNEYKNMSSMERKSRYMKWKDKEKIERELPQEYSSLDVIYNLIAEDYNNVIGIITSNGNFVSSSVFNYLSIINLLINRFPVIFTDEELYNQILTNLEIMKSLKLKLLAKKMLKKTINNLKRLGIEKKELYVELDSEANEVKNSIQKIKDF